MSKRPPPVPEPGFEQKTSVLPKAPKEKIEQYFRQANAFIGVTSFYQDMRSDGACLVAEFIAYQEGYTIRDWNE